MKRLIFLLLALALCASLTVPALVSADAGPSITHRVAPGENLSRLAVMYYGDRTQWKKIYEANRDIVKNPNLIFVGQELVIPGTAQAAPGEHDPALLAVLTKAGVSEGTAEAVAGLLASFFAQREALYNGAQPQADSRISLEIVQQGTQQLSQLNHYDALGGEFRVEYELLACRREESALLLTVYEKDVLQNGGGSAGREVYLTAGLAKSGAMRLEKERLQVFDYELEALSRSPSSSPMELDRMYTCTASPEEMKVREVAYTLAKSYLSELMAPSQARTYRITQYRDLEVELIPFSEMTREEIAFYHPTEEELREGDGTDRWLMRIRVEFQYEGDMEPYGTGSGQWVTGLDTREGFDFRLSQVGNDFTLQSRWLW